MIRLALTLALLAPLSAFAFTGLGNDGGGTWGLRVEIKVLASAVDADLVNVPVHVDPADLPSSFHTHVKPDACDVRITTADGTTEVPLEIVSYDSAANSGEFYFLAPALASATDTSFYIYYDNPSAVCYGDTNPLGTQAVWADFYAVLHDGSFNNVTANSNPTLRLVPSADIGAVEGIAGTATRFNANQTSRTGFYFPDPPVHVNGFYISSFVNYASLDGNGFGYLWQHGDAVSGTTEYYRMYESEVNSSTYPRLRGLIKSDSEDFASISSDFETTRTPVIGKWEHYAQYGEVGGSRGGLLNGQPLGTPTPMPAGFDPVSHLVVAIGGVDPSNGVFTSERDIDGIYDEFRLLMNVPQNVDAWAAFEHDNISDPPTTYSVQVPSTSTGEPVADFSADTVAGPSPLTVQFTDTSSDSGSPITAWSWDVDGDGQEDYTTQNPSHTYTTDGRYTVTLTVTNANGTDTGTRTDFIVASTEWWMQCGDPGDVLAVYDPWAVGEAGGTLAESYQDLSPAGNDASVSATGTAPTLGADGWVFEGDAVGGIDALDTGIIPTDISNFTAIVYAQDTAQDRRRVLNARSLNNIWFGFGLGNSATDIHLYSYGTDAAREIAPAITAWATIGLAGPTPFLDGVQDAAASAGSTANPGTWNTLRIGEMTNATGGVQWFTGSIRRVVISNSVLSAGQMAACHAAMVTDPGATPALPPVAQFSATPLTGEAPLAVQFTDSSTNTPTAWSWDVDNDGQEDYTTQNPQHTYSAAGTYTVALTVTNADGSDVETKTDYVTVSPASTTGDWWDSCGDSADLLGVYDPWAVGASGGNLAESYQDLSPAGNDAVVDLAGDVPSTAPTLTADGWSFDGVNNVLDTGITLTDYANKTMLIYAKHTGTANAVNVLDVISSNNTAMGFFLDNTSTDTKRYVFGRGPGSTYDSSPAFVDFATMGLSGSTPYFQGANDGSDLTGDVSNVATPSTVTIGGRHHPDGWKQYHEGVVRRAVIVGAKLTPAQVSACHTAMIVAPGGQPPPVPVSNMAVMPTTVTRSVRPGAAPVNADGFFDDYRPLP